MSPRFQSQPLLIIVAICFAFGYGHQILGRYQDHHHGAAQHEHSTPDSSQHDEQDSDHLWCHHSVTAVISSDAPLAVVQALVSESLSVPANSLPDAPVRAIEHPPQSA